MTSPLCVGFSGKNVSSYGWGGGFVCNLSSFHERYCTGGHMGVSGGGKIEKGLRVGADAVAGKSKGNHRPRGGKQNSDLGVKGRLHKREGGSKREGGQRLCSR